MSMSYGSMNSQRERGVSKRNETYENDDILTSIPNVSLSESLYAGHEPVLDDTGIDQSSSHHPYLFDNTMNTFSGRQREYGLGDHPTSPRPFSTAHTPFYEERRPESAYAAPASAPSAPTGELQSHWVTVFGFPRSKTTDILHIFRQYGEFLDQKSSGGNWIHICYATKLQAQQALAKNGKIINGDMMIGVTPCTDDSTWLKPLHMPLRTGPTLTNPTPLSAVVPTSVPHSAFPSSSL